MLKIKAQKPTLGATVHTASDTEIKVMEVTSVKNDSFWAMDTDNKNHLFVLSGNVYKSKDLELIF